MITENKERIFSCYIEIPDVYIINHDCINSDDYKKLQNVITCFCDSLRKVMLGEYLNKRSKKYLTISFDHYLLKENKVQETVYFDVNENIDDFNRYKSTMKKILIYVKNLLRREQKYARRKYFLKSSSIPNLMMSELDDCLIIEYSSTIIPEIANKVQDVLFKLYEINPDLSITIKIDDDNLKILCLAKPILPMVKRKTDFPDTYIAKIHNGEQSKNRYKFSITTNKFKGRPLEKITDKVIDEVRRIAKHEDAVQISVFHLVKELRGIVENIDPVEFVEIIDFDHSKKKMLFPLNESNSS